MQKAGKGNVVAIRLRSRTDHREVQNLLKIQRRAHKRSFLHLLQEGEIMWHQTRRPNAGRILRVRVAHFRAGIIAMHSVDIPPRKWGRRRRRALQMPAQGGKIRIALVTRHHAGEQLVIGSIRWPHHCACLRIDLGGKFLRSAPGIASGKEDELFVIERITKKAPENLLLMPSRSHSRNGCSPAVADHGVKKRALLGIAECDHIAQIRPGRIKTTEEIRIGQIAHPRSDLVAVEDRDRIIGSREPPHPRKLLRREILEVPGQKMDHLGEFPLGEKSGSFKHADRAHKKFQRILMGISLLLEDGCEDGACPLPIGLSSAPIPSHGIFVKAQDRAVTRFLLGKKMIQGILTP